MKPIPPPPPARFGRDEVKHGIELAPLATWIADLRGDQNLLKLEDMLQRFRTPMSHHRIDIRIVGSSSLPPSPSLDGIVDPEVLERWRRERGSPIIEDAPKDVPDLHLLDVPLNDVSSGSNETGVNGVTANGRAEGTDSERQPGEESGPSTGPTGVSGPSSGPSGLPAGPSASRLAAETFTPAEPPNGSATAGPSTGRLGGSAPVGITASFVAAHSTPMSRGGSGASAAKTLFAFSQGVNHMSPDVPVPVPDAQPQIFSMPSDPSALDAPDMDEPHIREDLPDPATIDFGGFTLAELIAATDAANEAMGPRSPYVDPGAPSPEPSRSPPRPRSPSPLVPEYAPPPGGTGRVARELRIDMRTLDASTLFFLEKWRREDLNLAPHELQAPQSKWYAPVPKKEKKAPAPPPEPVPEPVPELAPSTPVPQVSEEARLADIIANGYDGSPPAPPAAPSRSPSPDIILRDGFDGDKSDDPDFEPPVPVKRVPTRKRGRGGARASPRPSLPPETPVRTPVASACATPADDGLEVPLSRGRPRGRPRLIGSAPSRPESQPSSPAPSVSTSVVKVRRSGRGGPRGRPRGIGRGGRLLPHHPHFSGTNTPERASEVSTKHSTPVQATPSRATPSRATSEARASRDVIDLVSASPPAVGAADLDRLLNMSFPTPPRPSVAGPSKSKPNSGRQTVDAPGEPLRAHSIPLDMVEIDLPSPPPPVKRAKRGASPSPKTRPARVPSPPPDSPYIPSPVELESPDSPESSPILKRNTGTSGSSEYGTPVSTASKLPHGPRQSGLRHSFRASPDLPGSPPFPTSPLLEEHLSPIRIYPVDRVYVQLPPLPVSRDMYHMRLHLDPDVPERVAQREPKRKRKERKDTEEAPPISGNKRSLARPAREDTEIEVDEALTVHTFAHKTTTFGQSHRVRKLAGKPKVLESSTAPGPTTPRSTRAATPRSTRATPARRPPPTPRTDKGKATLSKSGATPSSSNKGKATPNTVNKRKATPQSSKDKGKGKAREEAIVLDDSEDEWDILKTL